MEPGLANNIIPKLHAMLLKPNDVSHTTAMYLKIEENVKSSIITFVIALDMLQIRK